MSETFTTALHSRATERSRSNLGRILGRIGRQPTTIAAAAIIVLIAIAAIAAPLLAPYDPTVGDLDEILAPPSAEHIFGTDDLGRDVLSRLFYGARIVLLVAVGSVIVAAVIGIPVGLAIGFFGGWWDRLGMRIVDMMQALPGMLIGITVIAILGRDPVVLMVAIGLIFSSGFSRIVRGSVLVERSRSYVDAAQVGGLTRPQIIFGQILPNVAGPIITQGAVFVGSAIAIESAMSFLGVGLSGDTASWGAMLSLAVDQMNTAGYLVWPPGIAIIVTVLVFNVLGDGINDAMTGERRRRPPRIQTSSAPAPRSDGPSDAALSATGVTVSIDRGRGERVDIVTNASLDVAKGEIVGLLGESGSGKSTFARAVLGMLPAGAELSAGSIRIDGEEIAGASAARLQQFRGGRMGAVFQDPMLALSPVHTVGQQLMEPLRIHQGLRGKQARSRAAELLDRVGVKDASARLDAYPHEFSGGMAQRVAIGMALAAEPDLLIADEATSALDVTTQSQVLDLILDLRDEFGMGVLMITHSLGVVAEACDRAAVLYRGRIVEDAPVSQLFDAPQHAYTRALLAANPAAVVDGGRLPTIGADERAAIDASIEELEAAEARS